MRMTKTFLFVAAGALAGWVTSGTALAQDPGGMPSGSPSEAQPRGTQQQAPTAMTGQLMTATATVEKVDTAKHEMTLKSDEGKPFTIQVPENVTRLENIKPGDKVRASFYESVAVSLQKPGEARVGEQKETISERAPGELPGGATAERITTTAKISRVDAAKDELTIETPQGKMTTIKVQDPQVRAQMKNLKVGDKIQTTFTTAMATSVTPQKSM
jgi:Cu/Ag efflux protein CusF